MSKRFDELYGEIVTILRRDYAGCEIMGDRFDPRYYNQAIGQAWHDDRLNELTFLRYVSQMLACIGDRHLRLELLPRENYQPWSPGFYTRRYADSLYVTALVGETRLAVGDRITAINGGTPSRHRAAIQKNFFYADTPQREDWHGLLKMADTITVQRPDGAKETIILEKHPLRAPANTPEVRQLPGGVVYARPGDGPANALADELDGMSMTALILDMRNARGDETDFWPLLPYLCRRETPMAELLGDGEFYVNYTPLNCAIRAAALEGVPGGDTYINELRQKAGQGFVLERLEPEDNILPPKAPAAVIVLADTWCRDGGEAFVQAAKAAGATVIGRPTLGTTDYSGDVSYALDERYVFTWPTAVTPAAREGRGVLLAGVAPDIYIPWMPAELHDDLLLARALETVQKT